jgi:flagellar assembly protein FliH
MEGLSGAFDARTLPRRVRSVLFEEDFAHPRMPPLAPAPEPEVIAPGPADTALTAARADAWAEGYAAGRAEAEAAGAQALADAAAALAAGLGKAEAIASEQAEANADALARLLMELFATAFPELSRRHGPGEAMALVRALLPGLAYEPAVQITIATDLAPRVEAELGRMLTDGQRERVQVSGSPHMAPGDVRLSWDRGMARRDGAALWAEVQGVLEAAGLAAPARQREDAHVG